ncbi:hypothetical protein [Spongiactinospora sp. 9N601]
MLIGRIPETSDAYLIADSKNPAASPLRFTEAELRAAGIDTTAVR